MRNSKTQRPSANRNNFTVDGHIGSASGREARQCIRDAAHAGKVGNTDTA